MTTMRTLIRLGRGPQGLLRQPHRKMISTVKANRPHNRALELTTPSQHQSWRRTMVSKADKRALTQQQVDGPIKVAPTEMESTVSTSPSSSSSSSWTAAVPMTENIPWSERFSRARYPLLAIATTVFGSALAYWLRFHSGYEMFQVKPEIIMVPEEVLAAQQAAKQQQKPDQEDSMTSSSSSSGVESDQHNIHDDDLDDDEKLVMAAAMPDPVGLSAVSGEVADDTFAAASNDEKSMEQKVEITETVEIQTTSPVVVQQEMESTATAAAALAGHKVITIQVPPIDPNRPPQVVPSSVSHPEGGNRVPITTLTSPVTTTTTNTMALPARDAVQELDDTIHQEALQTLQRARRALRSTLDETWLHDLEALEPKQLRIRIVQLAKELEERTKWEAVRLKEFLVMKEQETAERYQSALQQQRQELESLLARRLQEQGEELSKLHKAVLEEKDRGIETMMQDVMDALKAEHKAEIERLEVVKDKEANLKYQTEYANRLQEAKQKLLEELNQKVQELEALPVKLKELELALETSRSFESGSLKAHRLSAAALAFAEKLETSKSAAAELEILKAAAEENRVIASAVASLPVRVKEGVPTLSELQAKFETVHSKSRQAALVPTGRVGLEGQILGRIFATIKSAPNPDEAAPEDAKDKAEYVLSRARQYVKLGDLESAVEELNKLASTGQTAFTVQDWKQDALDRVAVSKVLRSIKLECALLNSSISSGSKPSPADVSKEAIAAKA